MPNYEKLYIKPRRALPKDIMSKVINYNSNTLEVVLERLEAGLVGELLIEDNINYPFIIKGDIIVLKDSNNIRLKDFILYKYKDKYYLRRVLKINGHEIYVAGDNEREYHVTTRDDIIAKGISRIRKAKYKSFNLKKKDRLYLFNKFNLQKLRIGSRIVRPENEDVAEAMTQAIKANLTRNVFVNKTIESKISDELDNELINFIDPDTLVLELQAELTAHENDEKPEKNEEQEIQEVVIEIPEEVEDTNSLENKQGSMNNEESAEDNNTDESQEDEVVEYVLEDGTPVDKDGNPLNQSSNEESNEENESKAENAEEQLNDNMTEDSSEADKVNDEK